MMDDGYNSAQLQLGLLGSGSFQGVGLATPGAVATAPQVMHPAEAALRAVSTSHATAAATQQQVASGNVPAAFGAAYRQNLSLYQSQQISPHAAQFMSGGGMGSMFPSPIHATSPEMGIYRPLPPPPAPAIPSHVQPPFYMPDAFSPRAPYPHFQTPFQYAQTVGQATGDQYAALAAAAPGAFGHLATAAGGAYLGRGMGAALGARIGGVRGAGIGSTVGMLGGLALSELGGVGDTAEHIVNYLNPMHNFNLRAAAMQSSSLAHVNGGANMAASGRGLSTSASYRLARVLQDTVMSQDFKQQTGGGFNVNDMQQLTNMAAQNGMLDAAQSPEQISKVVVGAAKQVRMLMQVAGSPDMRSAMQMLGQFRAMGLDASSEMGMQMATHARMAGTSVQQLIASGGQAGAATFQQNGLSAGLGLRMGMGNYGLAQMAVGAGAFNAADLAMAGGASGIAQRATEGNLAMLRMPLMTAAMSRMGSTGGFELDPNALYAAANGETDLRHWANAGVNNIGNAVAQRGVGAIGMFQMQQKRLQDQMGRALGAEGMEMMKMNMARSHMKELGLKGPEGFASAATMLFGEDEGSNLAMKGSSPDYFTNLQKQFNVERREKRAMARADADAAPGVLSRAWQRSSAAQALHGLSSNFWDGMETTGAFFHEMGEDRRLRPGEFMERTPSEFSLSSPEEAAGMRKFLKSGRRSPATNFDVPTTALATVGGVGIGNTEAARFVRDSVFGGNQDELAQYRRSTGSIFDSKLGGAAEKFLRFETLGIGFVDQEQVHAAVQKFAAGGKMIAAGLSASRSDISNAHGALDKALSRHGKGAGEKFSTLLASKLADAAEQKKNWHGGDQALDSDDIKKAHAEAAAEMGLNASETNAVMGMQHSNMTAATKTAAFMAGSGNAGAFTKLASADAGFSDMKKTITEIARNRNIESFETLVGKGGIFGSGIGGFSDKTRTKVQKAMFGLGTDKRATTLAALQAAAGEGGRDSAAAKQLTSYMQSLGGDRDEVMAKAQALSGDQDTRKALRLYAEKSLAGKSASEMEKITEGASNVFAGNAHMVHAQAGLSGLVQDTSLVESMVRSGGGKSALDALVNSTEYREGRTTGQLKKIADRYKATKDSKKREAIAQEYDDYIEARGAAKGEEEVKGGDLAPGESATDKKEEMAGATAAAMSQVFPDAVNTFSKATTTLNDAATKLGQYANDMANSANVRY